MIHSIFRIRTILSVFLGFVVLIIAGCISFYAPCSGTVVEKETGLPVKDAIVVRSWDSAAESVGGTVHWWLSTTEEVTDEKGKFSFGPHIFLHGIPILTGTEENLMLVYRPGYRVVFGTSSDSSVIELKKVPYKPLCTGCRSEQGTFVL